MLSNQKQRQSQIIAAQRDIFPATAESYHCSKGGQLSIGMGQELSIRLNVWPGNNSCSKNEKEELICLQQHAYEK